MSSDRNDLPLFSLEDIQADRRAIFIYGMSNVRTSSLIKAITDRQSNQVIAFVNPGGANLTSPKLEYHDLDQLAEVFAWQKRRLQHCRMERKPVPRVQLVIDNLVGESARCDPNDAVRRGNYNQRWEDSLTMGQLLMNGRCYGFGLILASRFLIVQRPVNCTQFDYVFLLVDPEFSESQLKRFYQLFCADRGDFVKWDLFLSVVHAIEPPHALVLDFCHYYDNTLKLCL